MLLSERHSALWAHVPASDGQSAFRLAILLDNGTRGSTDCATCSMPVEGSILSTIIDGPAASTTTQARGGPRPAPPSGPKSLLSHWCIRAAVAGRPRLLPRMTRGADATWALTGPVHAEQSSEHCAPFLHPSVCSSCHVYIRSTGSLFSLRSTKYFVRILKRHKHWPGYVSRARPCWGRVGSGNPQGRNMSRFAGLGAPDWWLVCPHRRQSMAMLH